MRYVRVYRGRPRKRALAEYLKNGSCRLVFILDDAPKDLVRLVGYLESISGDSVSIDLVTVAQDQIAGSQVSRLILSAFLNVILLRASPSRLR
jgi:hypothetical protein